MSETLPPYKSDPPKGYVIEVTCPQCQFPIRAGSNQYEIIEKGAFENGKQ